MESPIFGNGRIDKEYRLVVNRRFQVGPMIRVSQFGEVYLGIDILMKQVVEIKLENVNAEYPALLHESKVYNRLKGGVGISRVRWFGLEGDYNALVMDVMGVSLETLFNRCSRKFSLKTVLMLADKMINRVEFVHSKSFLHRDIKPNNFLIVASQQLREVYIGSFSLAKQYKDTSTHQHIPYRDGMKWKPNNATYSSINTYRGVEQSCRDDLESLGYVLMYFLRGSLPWQGVSASTRNDEEFERICEIKESISIEELCRGYPKEFAAYLNYCRSLRFDEKPDYAYLRKLFHRLFDRKGYRRDFKYDWVLGQTRLLHSLRTLAGGEEGRLLHSLRTLAGGEEDHLLHSLRTLAGGEEGRLLHSLRTLAGGEEDHLLHSLRTLAGGEEGVSLEDLRALLRSYPR